MKELYQNRFFFLQKLGFLIVGRQLLGIGTLTMKIRYNVIGKMETFDTDMKYVMNFVSKIKCSDKAIFTFQSLILLFVGKFEKY